MIDSTTQLYAQESNVYPIGAVADNNYGLIDNINSRALLEDSHLQGALEVFTEVDSDNHTTGAGGIAGKNHTTGIISNVTVGGAGAVKAGRGIGGVVAYNFGLIEHASVSATLPAGNQANSANSSNTYSYAGGIVGFNFGTIQFTSVSGRVFAQSAYAPAGDGNEGKNVGFGGIAGYNEGLIKESSFARSLAAKEFIDKSRASELQDAANNLGVASIHGDLYIGGIAGINAGEIDSSYVGGAIIGGRDFVGGVSGLTLTGSNIHHTYVFAEIAIKDNGGNKVTTPNNKTTVTTYQIAPNGFDAASTLFKALFNSETDQTWVPGDVASPKLPVFNQEDLTKVGNKFSSAGTLLWQQGAVTGVNIILDNLVLPFGSTMDIEFSVTPTNAPDLYTIWTSSDDGVVAIIGEGKVQGIGVGTATITVTTRDGGHTDAITITVDDYIHVDEALVTAEIELPEPNNATVRSDIEIGTILNFEVVILPEDAEYKGYVISSSNSRAIVTGNQVEFVTGNTGPGNVSIIVSFEDASLGALEYRFKTIPAPVEGVPISEVLVTAGEYVLPSVNNSNDRQEIETGESFILSVEILPNNASNKNYTIESSQPGRATVTDHTVNVIGTGNFSIKLTFEDTTVGNGGVLEYRFLGVLPEVPEEDTPIENVVVTTDTVTLPEPNNQSDRPEVTIGTVMVITIEILPENATNQNYTITVSNSRAQVSGNTVTFVTGSGAGNVSVVITFEDTSIGNNGVLEYRFKTVVA